MTGLAGVLHGGACLASAGGAAGEWTIGVAIVLCGAAILVGFLTPLVSASLSVTLLPVALGWAPSLVGLLRDPVAALFAATMAAAVACLGPGAFSLDAWLFGRREVVIR